MNSTKRLIAVLYCENDEYDSVLARKFWGTQLNLTVADSAFGAINLIGCQHFDFVLADYHIGPCKGSVITNHAMKLNIPCALFTACLPDELTDACPIWSKRSIQQVPDMIRSAISHPSSHVIDPAIFDTQAIDMKTRIMSFFGNEEKRHG